MLGFFRRGQGLFLDNHADTNTPVGEIVRGTSHAIPENEPVSTAIRFCLDGKRNIPVTDRKGERFLGIVNSRNILDFMGGGSLHEICVTSKDSLKTPVSRIMESGHREINRTDDIGDVLSVFKETGEETLPLVSGDRLDGMVSECDIIRQLSGKTGVVVSEVMIAKPIVTRTSHPLSEVAGMLVRGGYRRLPVVRDVFLTGIVTPFDILNYLNRNGNLGNLRRNRCEIEKVMNKSVFTLSPYADIMEAVHIMAGKGVAMLPVVEDYQIMGVLTQRDILEAM